MAEPQAEIVHTSDAMWPTTTQIANERNNADDLRNTRCGVRRVAGASLGGSLPKQPEIIEKRRKETEFDQDGLRLSPRGP